MEFLGGLAVFGWRTSTSQNLQIKGKIEQMMETFEKDIKMIKFQHFVGGVRQCVPTEAVTLGEYVDRIVSPGDSTRTYLDKIREAREAGDLERKAALKAQLGYYTPAVWLDGYRDSEHIRRFTGVAQLDFDQVEF